MGTTSDLEKKITTVGRELYSGATGIPSVFDTRGWIGRLMERTMKSEEFRNSVFRFIDVLPSLKKDELVTRLLREYISGGVEAPDIVSRAAAILPDKGILSHAAAPAVRKAVASLARQFIAADNTSGLVKTLRSLRADGTMFSIDLLGEVVVSDREAQKYRARYLALLDLLGRSFLDEARPDISIKASAFYSQLDPVDWDGSIERTSEAILPLLRKAEGLGISVTLDMEHYYYKGLTLSIFKSVLEKVELKNGPFPGIAIQAYIRDAEKDVRDLIGWARQGRRRITIRLVKGAYWDYELVSNRRQGWPVPVFLSKEETDQNFERLTRLLFENADAVYPAIASHNLRSIAHAAALADSLRIPAQDFEFQMLYGMAEPLQKSVRNLGYNLRIYIPVGELVPGMAYLVRRLLENTSNVSFLRRSFSEKVPFDELIKPPAVSGGVRAQNSSSGFRNEPPVDFSIEENRRQMREAIAAAKGGAGAAYPLLVGGRIVRTEKEIISRNPAHPEEVVGRVSSASKKEADEAIAEALKAVDPWRKTAPEKRADYLFRAAGEMRKRRMELTALEVIEVGKTWKDADGDIAEAIDYLEYYGREMIRLSRPAVLNNYPGEDNRYFYAPKGIGVVIAPWNFPLAIAAGMSSAAIVTGNCAIFKPSGLSPVTGYRMVEIFRAVGLPPGVLQFLPGPGSEVGEYLVSHPATDFIAFTGSKDVGLRIVRLAADTRAGQRNVKKVIAELGGKNAIIVDETADLDEAVKGIVESAFGYQGQKCSACSRLIVLEEVFETLCSRLAEAVSSLRIGPPEDPGNSIGPVIDESAAEKIRRYIEIGKQEGTVLIEREVSANGCFVGPVVFTDAKPDSRISTEEIFGPVLAVLKAKDIAAAIALANESRYALTGGLFSRSPRNIEKVKDEFLVGNLYINRKITGALVGRQPFGGFGMSGIGSKAGGPDYLLQFLNPVSISENTIRRGFAPLGSE